MLFRNVAKIAAVIVLTLMLAIPAGCADAPAGEKSIGQGQTLSGGDASLGGGANLKNVSVELKNSDTVVSLSFIKGSRAAGVDEAIISTVPEYTVSILPAPYRVRIDLAVDYSDFSSGSAFFTDNVVEGAFYVEQAETGKISLYLQLSDDVTVSASEEGSTLQLTLKPQNRAVTQKYFAGLSAYASYLEGKVPMELGLTPTMCSDLSLMMMISAPMDSAGAAQEFVDAANTAMEDSVPAQAYVFSMKTDALPVYVKPEEPARKIEEPAFGIDGEGGTLSLVVENGRYLCTLADGRIVYAKSYLPDSGQESEQVLKEELWTIDGSGTTQKLDVGDFYSVEQAAPSADGRFLAILDAGIDNKLLYVYDFEESIMSNMGEEGFGDTTTSFAWDTESSVIYAMTGHSGTLQLVRYDFENRAAGVSSVEENNGADSKIGMANGRLYFADKAAQVVYSVDIGTAERTEVAEGVGFAVSPDGAYLVSRVMVPVDEASVTFTLDLISLNAENSPVYPIVEGAQVEDIAFGADGTFYYTVQTPEGGEYAYEFWRYDVSTGDTAQLGYSKSGVFVPGPAAGQIYIIDYFIRDNNNYSVTFVYSEA